MCPSTIEAFWCLLWAHVELHRRLKIYIEINLHSKDRGSNFLLMNEFQRMFRSLQYSRAVSHVQQTQLPTPSQQGNRAEILPRESTRRDPMSHGSQLWLETGCRDKQVAQISSNKKQHTAKRLSNIYYNNLLVEGKGRRDINTLTLFWLREPGTLLSIHGL